MLLDHELKLLETKGYEEVKALLDEWSQVRTNMHTSIDQAKIFLPNYFFIADPGVGLSYLVHVISEHLFCLGIIPFSNTQKYIEFLLEYDENPQTFKSFERLYNLLEHGLSQYGQPFAGVLMIHITEWIQKGEYTSEKFHRFLDYLTQRDDIQMIIFVSESSRHTDNQMTESLISKKIRIRKVRISTSPAEVLLEKLVDLVKTLGIEIEADGKDVLLNTIRKAMKSHSFNGMFTIKSLAKDIVYETYRKKDMKQTPLTAQDLSMFDVNGSWLKQLDFKL
jgi:hypothetical protein